VRGWCISSGGARARDLEYRLKTYRTRGSMLSHRYDDFDVCDGIVLPSLSINAIEKGTGPRPASREGLRPDVS
jgi:hypothetical protein